MTTAQKSLIHKNILNIFLSSVLILLSDLKRTRALTITSPAMMISFLLVAVIHSPVWRPWSS